MRAVRSRRSNGRPAGSGTRYGHAVRAVPRDEPSKRFLPAFADRLRFLREEQDVSVDELAAALDVNNATVHSWETGRVVPPLPTVYRVAMALGIRPADLLEVDE